jgi:ribosomal protein L37AE/L43A
MAPRPRATCPECGRTIAVRRTDSGLCWFARHMTRPYTSPWCVGDQLPVRVETEPST